MFEICVSVNLKEMSYCMKEFCYCVEEISYVLLREATPIPPPYAAIFTQRYADI